MLDRHVTAVEAEALHASRVTVGRPRQPSLGSRSTVKAHARQCMLMQCLGPDSGDVAVRHVHPGCLTVPEYLRVSWATKHSVAGVYGRPQSFRDPRTLQNTEFLLWWALRIITLNPLGEPPGPLWRSRLQPSVAKHPSLRALCGPSPSPVRPFLNSFSFNCHSWKKNTTFFEAERMRK